MHGMTKEEYKERVSYMAQWADTLRIELTRLIEDSPPNTIYHYTDITGLLGLVKSGCIWATHVNRLNDSSENRHGFKFIGEYVRNNTPPASKPLFDRALSGLHSVDTYIACYSTADDLLSQWRNYVRTQVGYSLGFDIRLMVSLDERIPLLEPIIYQEQRARNVLDHLIGRVNAFTTQNPLGEVEAGFLLGTLEAWLNIYACTIKHHSFEEEREYRHFYQPGRTKLELAPVFRSGQFGLTPYVEIYFLENRKLPLKTITIGPCQDFNLEFNALRILLDRYEYQDVEVLQSEIPLRF